MKLILLLTFLIYNNVFAASYIIEPYLGLGVSQWNSSWDTASEKVINRGTGFEYEVGSKFIITTYPLFIGTNLAYNQSQLKFKTNKNQHLGFSDNANLKAFISNILIGFIFNSGNNLLWYEMNLFNKISGKPFDEIKGKSIEYDSYHRFLLAQKLSRRTMLFFSIGLKSYESYETLSFVSRSHNDTSFSIGLSFPLTF